MDAEYMFDRNRIEEVLSGNSEIEESEQIEDALIIIQAAQKKVEFLKKLKQKRINPIQKEISIQEERVEKLKEAITKCMIKNKEKTLDFPDLAKITIKKSKGTWIIDDESNLVKHLKSLNKFEEVGEEVVQFQKMKLNKVLDDLEKNNNVSNLAHRDETKDSLSISYSVNRETVKESIDDMLPSKEVAIPMKNYDPIIPSRNLDIDHVSPPQSVNLNDLNF